MKISRLPRIYIEDNLTITSDIILNEENRHYVRNVLRLKDDDKIRVFNGRDGELEAKMGSVGGQLSIRPVNFTREPYREKPLILGLSLIKTDKMLEAISAATALGVTEIVPVIAERSQLRTINKGRILKVIMEAVRQSERFQPPLLHDPVLFGGYIKDRESDLLIYANENEAPENSILKISQQLLNYGQGISLLIGPEGGFAEKELAMLAVAGNTKSVSLGSAVLRAEIATIAMLAQLQLFRR